MKCTRQRCHDESVNCWATAAFSPAWALQMTRCTPARPRARSEAKTRARTRRTHCHPPRYSTLHACPRGSDVGGVGVGENRLDRRGHRWGVFSRYRQPCDIECSMCGHNYSAIQRTPNKRPASSTPVIRMHIQPGDGLRRSQRNGQLQLCVPLVAITSARWTPSGRSWRPRPRR